tara:strand:+ start:71 stop:271 length:201 start_codon:yes stop_codon:yes gene_type:complete
MEYKYVSFDIADQSFKFYTSLDWHNLIADARETLCKSFGTLFWADATLEELLDGMYGDEFFWQEIA